MIFSTNTKRTQEIIDNILKLSNILAKGSCNYERPTLLLGKITGDQD